MPLGRIASTVVADKSENAAYRQLAIRSGDVELRAPNAGRHSRCKDPDIVYCKPGIMHECVLVGIFRF